MTSPPMMPVIISVTAALLATGCVDTGQSLVAYPAHGRGTGSSAVTVGGWQVELDAAQLSFGPVYFCATRAASTELCPAAVNESITVHTVDLLDGGSQPLGEVVGVTGYVGSATYDYGITWLPTESQPMAKEGSASGHSLVLEGSATAGDRRVNFVARVNMVPGRRGGQVVEGHPLDEVISEDVERLAVEIDGDRWVQAMDFDELEATGDDPVVVVPGMRSYEALVIAATVNHKPTFTWEFEP